MRCPTCLKNEAVPTRLERVKNWMAWHMFPIDLKEEKSSAFTQGFMEGYQVGRKHERELNDLAFIIQNDIHKSTELNGHV